MYSKICWNYELLLFVCRLNSQNNIGIYSIDTESLLFENLHITFESIETGSNNFIAKKHNGVVKRLHIQNKNPIGPIILLIWIELKKC